MNRAAKYQNAHPYTEHPLARLIIALAIYATCFFIINRYGNAGLAMLCWITGIRRLGPYTAAFLKMLIMFILMLIACFLVRESHIFYRRHRSFLHGLFVGGFMLIYALVSCCITLAEAAGFQDIETITFSVLYFLLVGIVEELVFRGITADLLMQIWEKRSDRRQTVYIPVIISGLIFALAHAFNVMYADVSGVFFQMLSVFVLGMFLTAVYYRTENLYAVMFLHAANDIAAALPVTVVKSSEKVADVISSYGPEEMLILIPYIIVLVFILRLKKRDEIYSLLE